MSDFKHEVVEMYGDGGTCPDRVRRAIKKPRMTTMRRQEGERKGP
jgi:hypothetical protein